MSEINKMRDRICVSKKNKERLDKVSSVDKAPLFINKADNKDIFAIAVALGCECPREVQNRYGAGWFLKTSVKKIDEALLAATLLGVSPSDETVNENANMDSVIDYTEQCAETGFDALWERFDSANGNEELLERRLMNEMTIWYTCNVKACKKKS